MIVYLFNNDFFKNINLPVKISGMYSLNCDDRLIVNISSSDDTWNVNPSYEFISADVESCGGKLIPYYIYKINSIYGNKSYQLIAVPKYDNSASVYNLMGNISIGNNPSCDIYYPYCVDMSNGNEVLQLQQNSNNGLYWTVSVSGNNFFVSSGRAVKGMTLRSGDYIFFMGLRVILIGSRIIINNPNGNVSIKAGNISNRAVEGDYRIVENKDEIIDMPLFKKEDYYFKAPRFNFIIETENVKIDEPPTPEKPNEMSILLTVGPQLTMVSTSVLSMVGFISSYLEGSTKPLSFAISMGTMVITITGALLWPLITRKMNEKNLRKREEKRVREYTKYLERKKNEIDLIKTEQKSTLLNNHPSTTQCVNIILNRTKELWQRSIEHEDFLSIRLGIGNTDAKILINSPTEKFNEDGEDELFTKMKQITGEAKLLNDVPITYTFTNNSINAIVGTPTEIKQFMDCLFLQIMTFHSYTDLKIVAFINEPDKWEYLKIAPHCWNNQRSARYFATSVEELNFIATDLEKIFDARVSDDDNEKLKDNGQEVIGSKDFDDFRPYYLFFIDDMTSIRNVTLINKILKYKRNMGFSLILTSSSISLLPAETSSFICLGEKQSAIIGSEINNNQQIFVADFNRNVDVYKCVQMLANIPIQLEKGKYELPASLSFLELYGLGRVEQLNTVERWSQNNPVISLSVPIGIDQNGEIFKLDIHEKAYGPHGLVAGTTGSGKSEWIVTYILSLAVNFSPEEVQFLLIDYKGGGLAKSFENEELKIKLPHLAGTITNLDKSEIFRAIAAIQSELKRRQAVFNDVREKLKDSSMNIYKYQQYYRKGLIKEPMSHLLIICDEFAELKQQQPEFMDELISTSRIGRSLGVHLILATQKPSGVVNDQIWSNSRFKVCLKVQDKGDSNEVLRKPDAANLKQTGSFYLQVGNDEYYNLGQSAWAGAKYYPSDTMIHKIDDSIKYIDNTGRTIGYYEESQENTKKESQGEELLNIVSYISSLIKEGEMVLRPLWLDNIPDRIFLADILKKYNHVTPEKYTYNVPIGEYDEPRRQSQGLLELNLQDGNIAIMGQGDSGIDSLLSTIIYSSVIEHTPYEIAYYIIDFGAETLKKFAKLPHVGEVVFQSDKDRLIGVLDLLYDEFSKRKKLLSDYNGSFEYYNKVSKNDKLPLMILMVNGYDIFIESYSKLDDFMSNMFRDAPKYGIVFIVTASTTSALRQRQLQFFNHIILLQLNDEDQYRNMTNCRRGLVPRKNAGRGICKYDATDSDSYSEFQTALIADESVELDVIKKYSEKCVSFYNYKVKQLAKIPDDVSSKDLIKYITTLSEVPIGTNFYEKDIAKFNLLHQKINIVTGKKASNNMKFIYAFVSVLANIQNVKIRIVDFNSVFKKPILDIKLFNSNLDVVFAALEKDAIERKMSQDYAINIIIGVSQYKQKLSSGGVEIFKSLFDKINMSKKNIYVLIDDYEKIRVLKFDSWFNNVNTNYGLWLGGDISNQSLLSVKEITDEDKKFQYEGLAYSIENQEYKVIKTALDGDE